MMNEDKRVSKLLHCNECGYTQHYDISENKPVAYWDSRVLESLMNVHDNENTHMFIPSKQNTIDIPTRYEEIWTEKDE